MEVHHTFNIEDLGSGSGPTQPGTRRGGETNEELPDRRTFRQRRTGPDPSDPPHSAGVARARRRRSVASSTRTLKASRPLMKTTGIRSL